MANKYEKKKYWIIIIIVLIAVSTIFFLTTPTKYQYITPKDKTCDFSLEIQCEANGCNWRVLSDVMPPPPGSGATCCPRNVTIDYENWTYSEDDPCSWLLV